MCKNITLLLDINLNKKVLVLNNKVQAYKLLVFLAPHFAELGSNAFEPRKNLNVFWLERVRVQLGETPSIARRFVEHCSAKRRALLGKTPNIARRFVEHCSAKRGVNIYKSKNYQNMMKSILV